MLTCPLSSAATPPSTKSFFFSLLNLYGSTKYGFNPFFTFFSMASNTGTPTPVASITPLIIFGNNLGSSYAQ